MEPRSDAEDAGVAFSASLTGLEAEEDDERACAGGALGDATDSRRDTDGKSRGDCGDALPLPEASTAESSTCREKEVTLV